MEILHLTKDNFDITINAGTTMVDFWAGWCGPCKMLAPLIDGLAAEVNSAKVAKVDVDSESELTLRYKVMSIPTVIVFSNGQEIKRFIGIQPKEVYMNALTFD